MNLEGNLDKLYQERFKDKDLSPKNAIWEVLCENFFQQFIPKNSTVMDLGAGYCEFINNIECDKKYAVDLNKQTPKFADPDVKVESCASTSLETFIDASIDVVFVSNFLEHLRSKEDVITTLAEVFRVLKKDGKVLILQPNIRYLYREYWDFFDHHIPLSDKSLIEVLQIVGFKIGRTIPKFLPYTTKSRLPKAAYLVKIYLKFPFMWKIFGKQTFVLAIKP